ncbi:NUDIX domain-containing protein [Wenyingzhuangia sp. 2_MG-2023]|uniref:NUDIX hydrolase n=1 Tax=Wenyingzhuangia sp. 2_MG-2023 TaxID=3062639 RepID=UPI0026E405DE|nr:NUDIX domain-containing protein [Wenyingzhuangia sp. 2_MG-2023]MDO6739041.1 NUDIX domain-containing protein [Wenyingzhuangia sp. 2_MG-2023]
MDELIDIVNLEGQPTGNACLKSFAHQNGILHASVHIWLYTKDQKILVQKRKNTKETFPGLWDISVAGHIGTGETTLQAAVREIAEEIGCIMPTNHLNYLRIWEDKHYHSNGITDHEIHHIYVGELTLSLEQLTPQQEEVAAIKFIDINELSSDCNNPQLFVPHPREYYQYIINTLKERF